MFIGHGLLAFAAVAAALRWRGHGPRRALAVGAVAALFATLPDVDMVYAPVGLLGGASGLFGAAEAFWAASTVAHRGPTHSVVVGLVAALAFGAVHDGRPTLRAAGLAGLAGVVTLATVRSGPIAGVVTLVFAVGGLAVLFVADHLELSTGAVTGAAAVGLVSHPFGDLFTGEPPAFLYPFETTLLAERVALSGDPTLHLLGAFAIELAVLWLALAVFFGVRGGSLTRRIDRRALVGVASGLAVFALPAPTLDVSYHFVFGVLGLGVVSVAPRRLRVIDWGRTIPTAVATVTVALLTYGLTYLLL